MKVMRFMMANFDDGASHSKATIFNVKNILDLGNLVTI